VKQQKEEKILGCREELSIKKTRVTIRRMDRRRGGVQRREKKMERAVWKGSASRGARKGKVL